MNPLPAQSYALIATEPVVSVMSVGPSQMEAAVSTATESLPYIDNQYNERAAEVEIMIKNELDTMDTPERLDAIEEHPLFAESSILQEEMERLERGEKLDVIKVAIREGGVQDVQRELQYEYTRMINLSLMSELEGTEKWNKYLKSVTSRLVAAKASVDDVKEQIDVVNRKRKLAQTQAKARLDRLSEKRRVQVRKNLNLLKIVKDSKSSQQ